MKHTLELLVLSSFSFFGFGTLAFADCNLQVATAAGQYLSVLEKTKLTKYQNNSVCEVLQYEVSNCSKPQVAKMAKAFDLKAVLGNYCQPHLPPPKESIAPDQFAKGAELYSWKEYNGYYWYAILPGTNRAKTANELVDHKMSEGEVKQVLMKIPANTGILWNNLATVADKEKLDFALPPAPIAASIKKIAVDAKLKFE